MPVLIRKAVLADLPALLKLSEQARVFHNRLLNNYFADINPQTERAFLEKAVQEENKIFLVALKDEETIGMLSAGLKTLPYLSRSYVCQVDTLCVDENHRREGIGRLLISELKKICADADVDEIDLSVYMGNSEAFSFYESLGFSVKKQEMRLDLKDKN